MTDQPEQQFKALKYRDRADADILELSAYGDGPADVLIGSDEWDILYRCLSQYGLPIHKEVVRAIQQLGVGQPMDFLGERLVDVFWYLYHAIVSPYGASSLLCQERYRGELLVSRTRQIVSGAEPSLPLVDQWKVQLWELWWLLNSQPANPSSAAHVASGEGHHWILADRKYKNLPTLPLLSDFDLSFRWLTLYHNNDFIIVAVEIDNFDDQPLTLGPIFSNIELSTSKIKITDQFRQDVAIESLRRFISCADWSSKEWLEFFSRENSLFKGNVAPVTMT